MKLSNSFNTQHLEAFDEAAKVLDDDAPADDPDRLVQRIHEYIDARNHPFSRAADGIMAPPDEPFRVPVAAVAAAAAAMGKKVSGITWPLVGEHYEGMHHPAHFWGRGRATAYRPSWEEEDRKAADRYEQKLKEQGVIKETEAERRARLGAAEAVPKPPRAPRAKKDKAAPEAPPRAVSPAAMLPLAGAVGGVEPAGPGWASAHKPGDRFDVHGRVGAVRPDGRSSSQDARPDNAPDWYKSDPRWSSLIKDSANGDRVTAGSVREAMAMIEAERMGIIAPPVRRPRKADGDDRDDGVGADGVRWDVKEAIIHPLGYDPNGVPAQCDAGWRRALSKRDVRLLIDTTYIGEADWQKFTAFLDAWPAELKSRVSFVNTRWP